jgi:hypothetical protein
MDPGRVFAADHESGKHQRGNDPVFCPDLIDSIEGSGTTFAPPFKRPSSLPAHKFVDPREKRYFVS